MLACRHTGSLILRRARPGAGPRAVGVRRSPASTLSRVAATTRSSGSAAVRAAPAFAALGAVALSGWVARAEAGKSRRDGVDASIDAAQHRADELRVRIATLLARARAQQLARSKKSGASGWWGRAKRLLGLLKKEWKLLALAATMAAAASAVALLGPAALGAFTDALAQGSGVTGPLLKLAAVYLSRALLQFMYNTTLASATDNIATDLRRRLFDRLVRDVSIGFFDAANTNELVQLLADDVKTARDGLRRFIANGTQALAQVVGGSVAMFLLSPQMTFGMAGVLPLMVGVGTLFGRQLRRANAQSQQAQAEASGVVGEALANVRTVRMFTGEDFERGRYLGKLAEESRMSRKMGSLMGLWHASFGLGMGALAGGVLWRGSSLVKQGAMTPGDVTTFMLLSLRVEASLGSLSVLASETSKAVAAAERVLDVIDYAPVHVDAHAPAQQGAPGAPPAGEWDSLAGDVRFEQVRFSYPTRKGVEVLKGVDITLPAGKVVAVVGTSGGGKSTLVQLLERFYEPDAGRITVGGRPIIEADRRWLRQRISVVPQDTTLFATSIRANIKYGCDDATDAEVERAARAANAHGFVSAMPHGYDTVVGERGVTVSGGQRQRLALARALLRNPSILLLDEATSALDAESEAVVQEALSDAMRGRAVMVIAHRLSTVQKADSIVVLDGGRVVEQGTHAELMARKRTLPRARGEAAQVARLAAPLSRSAVRARRCARRMRRPRAAGQRATPRLWRSLTFRVGCGCPAVVGW